MKKILLVLVSVLILCDAEVFADSLIKDKYSFSEHYLSGYDENPFYIKMHEKGNNVDIKPLYITMDEASKYTISGNPLDYFVECKKIFPNTPPDYLDVHEEGEYYEYDPPTELIEPVVEMMDKLISKANVNIANKTIPISQCELYLKNSKKKAIRLKILIIFIFLISIIMIKVFNLKYVIIISVLSVISFFFITPNNKNVDMYNHIEEYIMGKSQEHISKEVNIEAEFDRLRPFVDTKFRIPYSINDYIVKMNICAANKMVYDEDKRWYLEKVDYNDSRKDHYITLNTGYLNANKIFNVTTNILEDGIFFEDLQKLQKYFIENYTDNYSVDDFNNKLIDALSDLIPFEEISMEEHLFHYVGRIIPEKYITQAYDDFDYKVLSYLKNWYISGESRDISLPYGIKLEYRKPEMEKMDIKEILYTNEEELDHNSTDDQAFIMYYKDSNDRINYKCTSVKFVKTGKDYEIYLKPFDLFYKIKKATLKLSV